MGPRPIGSALSYWGAVAARAWCPAGVGLEERSVALEAAGTCGAELLSILLYSSAAGAGRGGPHVPSCASKPASACGAAPGICSVC